MDFRWLVTFSILLILLRIFSNRVENISPASAGSTPETREEVIGAIIDSNSASIDSCRCIGGMKQL